MLLFRGGNLVGTAPAPALGGAGETRRRGVPLPLPLPPLWGNPGPAEYTLDPVAAESTPAGAERSGELVSDCLRPAIPIPGAGCWVDICRGGDP